jgi:uncharacterized coiled-coil protein SlyX
VIPLSKVQANNQSQQKMKPKKMTTLSIRNSLSRPPLRCGLPRKQQLPRTQAMWIIRGFLLIPLALAWLALSPTAQACREGCDTSNGNTFLGDGALTNNTTGAANTAIGVDALLINTTGNNNTATGEEAASFSSNTGSENTAIGSGAFDGGTGSNNTGNGEEVLEFNTSGNFNTANGRDALLFNTTGNFNTATGVDALFFNTTGGSSNTANGDAALQSNATGSFNTATGYQALVNTTGSSNIALGTSAGSNLTTGSNNIDIAAFGTAGESNTIRIGKSGIQKSAYVQGIFGATVASGVGVIVGSNGQLGTVVSSERFKEAIKPMDKASEAIFALQPVTFRYKRELDPEGIPQFGLVAEQVEKVNPDLVARDDQGKPYTVRYEAVNAMLLNEFLKEHRKVEEQEATITQLESTVGKQEATIAQQQKGMEVLAARFKEQGSQLQKVSDQLELRKSAPQMVANNQ